MKDIEKDLSQEPALNRTTSLKPVGNCVLSEGKLHDVINASTSSGWLLKLGITLKRHRKTVTFIQWLLVILYFVLLLVPVLIQHWGSEKFYVRISDFSRLMFWGVGWPVIILSIMLLGRIWCGLLCPDGTLTEFISRHGQKRSIPRWIRWKGWPCTILVTTVLYGQLIGVYDNFPATLILLGIPTCLALACGFLYGNGKRIWCMYLCPGNGIFGLLAKLSPVYYRVDEKKWKAYSGDTERLDCPTLINVRQMKSMSACHACGRCIGHRHAVEPGLRYPSSEILAASKNGVSDSETFLLLWGIIGICTAALAWRGNGLYTFFLSALNSLYTSGLPWYFSARPESLLHLAFILISGSFIALETYALLRLSALVSGETTRWKQLALCLIPVSCAGIFLGLCQISFRLWQVYGFNPEWIPAFQYLILATAALFSFWLGLKTICHRISTARLIALFVYSLSIAQLAGIWVTHFQA